jgi:hypothetical protein
MHIIKSIAFACAAFCATQAHALDGATTNATPLKVYVSGASALSGSINGLLTQNCIATTRTTYTYTQIYPGTTSAAAFGTINSCSLVAGNDFGLPVNTNIVFQKRDAGGSGVGVYPVSNGTPIDFINPASCTGPASGTGTCTTLFQRPADGGVSDVEPGLFSASLNTPPESVGSSVGNQFTSQPINQTIFGLAVTQNLYAALQAEQGLSGTTPAGRPNISQAVAGQMLRNNFLTDPISWKLLLPNASATAQNSQVTICRRVNGSGTQASANRFFLEYPFNSGAAQEPLVAGDSTDFPNGTHGTAANKLFVIENSATADSRNCMTAANTAGGFALGHISLENAETAAWKFVKVGGQEPSRDEAKAGRYAYFFESTGQIFNGAPANVKTFLTAFFNGAGLPANLAQLSGPNQAGVMARPQTTVCPSVFGSATYSVAAGDAINGPVPAVVNTFCARVTRNGNSAEFPGFFR